MQKGCSVGASAVVESECLHADNYYVRIVRDERGIVIDWLLKLVVMLAVLGVVGYDAGSIAVNYFTLDSAANDTANAVSLAISQRPVPPNQGQLILEVEQLVTSGETGATTARVVEKGTFIDSSGVIHIELRRTADTIVVSQIPAIRDWAKSTADGRAASN
jgi:hypothetical protein